MITRPLAGFAVSGQTTAAQGDADTSKKKKHRGFFRFGILHPSSSSKSLQLQSGCGAVDRHKDFVPCTQRDQSQAFQGAMMCCFHRKKKRLVNFETGDPSQVCCCPKGLGSGSGNLPMPSCPPGEPKLLIFDTVLLLARETHLGG